jgi:PTH1 family peptidyl-tRNA hydrolase
LELVQFYKPDMSQLLVIYDDIDIAVGTIRIRERGSAGTHNGMRSIIYQLQEDTFPRIRIGIGKPEGIDLASFVLSHFRSEEQEDIRSALENAALAAETIVEKSIQEAMNKYNG